MSSTFLVTGATGFLGGYLTAELLRQGHRVIAPVRPRWAKTPQQRMDTLMEFFEMDPEGRLEVVEGYIDRPNLGLEGFVLQDLRSKVEHVLHCAADTSFASRKSEQVEKINLQGLQNVFDAFKGCGHFHYMGTAYSAGVMEGKIPEEIVEPEDYHNPYERSKNLAEKEITRLASESGTPLTIYRPSIVYGDSVSGKSLKFNALYYPVRIVLFLKDSMEKDILEKDGKRAEELGVTLDNGVMNMPIVTPDTGGWIDLIPIDHLVRSTMAIIESGETGIFHIVNPDSNTLAQLIDFIQSSYPITGISTIKDTRGRDPTALETLIDGYVELYYPYLCDKRHFDDTRAKAILDRAGITCPVLDLDSFKRIMDFAVEKDFGSKLRI